MTLHFIALVYLRLPQVQVKKVIFTEFLASLGFGLMKYSKTKVNLTFRGAQGAGNPNVDSLVPQSRESGNFLPPPPTNPFPFHPLRFYEASRMGANFNENIHGKMYSKLRGFERSRQRKPVFLGKRKGVPTAPRGEGCECMFFGEMRSFSVEFCEVCAMQMGFQRKTHSCPYDFVRFGRRACAF